MTTYRGDGETLAHPVSAHDVALHALRQMILNGDFPPGGRIVQDTVAAELGISVIPVREGLKSLEGEGLVVFKPRRGFFVVQLSKDELVEISSIRSALEGMAIRQSSAHWDDAVVSEMEAAVALMDAADAANDVLAFLQADRRFHFALFIRWAGSQLCQLITLMWDRSDHYRAAFLSGHERRRCNRHEHEAMLAAVRERDVDQLLVLLDEHRLGPASVIS